jgi:hypothetical protein
MFLEANEACLLNIAQGLIKTRAACLRDRPPGPGQALFQRVVHTSMAVAVAAANTATTALGQGLLVHASMEGIFAGRDAGSLYLDLESPGMRVYMGPGAKNAVGQFGQIIHQAHVGWEAATGGAHLLGGAGGQWGTADRIRWLSEAEETAKQDAVGGKNTILLVCEKKVTYVDGSDHSSGPKAKGATQPKGGGGQGYECPFCSQGVGDKGGHRLVKCPRLLDFATASGIPEPERVQAGIDEMRRLNENLIDELLHRPFLYPTLANFLPGGADFVPPPLE